MIAAARELPDWWLELANAGETLNEGAGKYDVAKVAATPVPPLAA